MYNSIEEFFAGLQSQIDPSKSAGMNVVYQFVVSGGPTWHVKLADGTASVESGAAENPTITLTAGSAEWVDIVNGKLNGQTAFLTGKLKIQGDMNLAMKLESLFKIG